MRKIFLNSLFFLAIGLMAKAGWYSQTSGTTAAIPAIHFVDSLNGWFVSVNGEIFNTNDGGGTWHMQYDTTIALRSVHFINKDTGWVIGDKGTILRTIDGGADWSNQYTTDLSTNDFRDVFFMNNFGITGGLGGNVYVTSNYGITWKKRASVGGNVHGYHMVDTLHGFMAH